MNLLQIVNWSYMVISLIGSLCFIRTHCDNDVDRNSNHFGLELFTKRIEIVIQHDESLKNVKGQAHASKYTNKQHISLNKKTLKYSHQVTNIPTLEGSADARIVFRHIRRVRDTSKFTGLVVGASSNQKQQQLVNSYLKDIEASFWKLQSQKTSNFEPKDQTPATIMGSFMSVVKVNFHGTEPQSQLRHSKDYIVPDVNSLSTLLILTCLTESQLYGLWQDMSTPSFDLAIQSLEHFQSRQHLRQSPILTLWPEKVLPTGQSYINYPENIVLTKMKNNNTLEILQNLVKSFNCEPAKSALVEINGDPVCREYFNTSFSDTIFDQATPPDLLTSSMNLALGSLLHTRVDAANKSIFQTELNMWQSSNSDVQVLIKTLKSLAVTLSRDGHQSENALKQVVNNDPGRGSDLLLTRDAILPPTKIIQVYVSKNISDNNTYPESDNTAHQSDNTTHQSDNTTLQIDNTTLQSDNTAHQSDNTTHQSDNTAHQSDNTTHQSDNTAHQSDNTAHQSDNTTHQSDNTTHQSDNTTYHDRDNILPGKDADLPAHGNIAIPDNKTQITASTKPFKTNNVDSLLPMTDGRNASDIDHVIKMNSSSGALTAANDTSNMSKSDAQSASIINKPAQTDQILDSASYYGLSFYLNQQLQQGKDVVLIPTWISLDNDGDVRHNNQLFHSYNSIDLTTTASVVHSLLVAHINGLIDIVSDDLLKKIIQSSLHLLEWYVSHPHELNTFLSLSRFPSRSQFYWLLSRIAFQLQSVKAKSKNMFKFATEETVALLTSLQNNMTYSILESIVDGGLGTDGKTRVFIDDFIGIADIDIKNSKKITGDDRLFASAMAVNTLISTWTVQHSDGKLKFIDGTDDSVRIAVNSLVNYVSTAVGDATTLLDNAFMTDQVKNCYTFSAFYPSNIITNKEGKPVQTEEKSYKLRYGVKGYFSQDSYQKELDNPKFSKQWQLKSTDALNCPTSLFHYWSSQAYTRAACVLAISQSANLQIEHN